IGNRPAAIETYDRCVQTLAETLDVEPSAETQELARWIKQAAIEKTSLLPRITNLPIPLTSFIGRTHETAEIKSLLNQARLVTLTGAGGTGKTRLSIQVGMDLLDAFKAGVWWVELGSVMDPEIVPKAVAKTLGIAETINQSLTETIAESIGARPLLLILDNCEHLIAATAQLAEHLLLVCPHLVMMATSREPLNIPGEQVWHAPTLSIPPVGPATVAETLLSYEAIRLFVDRARAIRSDLALTAENAAAIAQICRQLDGIPLAIELAAARVRSLSPAEIAARLDDRFNLLTAGSRTALPRQQTLRALIDWSYNLLSESEQQLLRRLAVFAGGWTVDAAEQVTGFRPPARDDALAGMTQDRLPGARDVDLLARLVDKSLVLAQTQTGESRYSMLETIREYARDKLEEAGLAERDTARTRHLNYFRDRAVQIEPQLRGAQQMQWMRALEVEHDNIRAALTWAHSSNQIESGLELATALWRFWKVRGYYSEGRRWYALLLAQSREGNCAAAPATCARALYAAGMLAYYQSDPAPAARLHEEALSIRRELGDPHLAESLAGLGLVMRLQGDDTRAAGLYQTSLELARAANNTADMASALCYLGLVAINQGDTPRAIQFYEQALPLTRQSGDPEALANLLNNLGIAETYQNNLERGEALTAESLAIRRQLDDPHGTALSLHTLSYHARMRKEWPRARDLLCEALGLYQVLGTKENAIECLESIAVVEYEMGQFAQAAQLYGATAQLRETYHIPTPPMNRPAIETENAQAQARLGPDAFARAWEQGRALSLEETIAFAQRAIS
ncbi:MAG: tetratricopeptide repeat protein, partial [Anaerolineae bacterium]